MSFDSPSTSSGSLRTFDSLIRIYCFLNHLRWLAMSEPRDLSPLEFLGAILSILNGSRGESNGPERIRTADLLIANEAF